MKPKTHSDLQNVLNKGDVIKVMDHQDIDRDIRGRRFIFKGYSECEYIGESDSDEEDDDGCMNCKGRMLLFAKKEDERGFIKCMAYVNVQPIIIKRTAIKRKPFLTVEEMTI